MSSQARVEPAGDGLADGSGRTDRFLSEEDLDLKNLSWEELVAVWNAWLQQASATDVADAGHYSHGVFVNTSEPGR